MLFDGKRSRRMRVRNWFGGDLGDCLAHLNLLSHRIAGPIKHPVCVSDVLQEYKITIASIVDLDCSLVIPITAAIYASTWLQLHDLAKLPVRSISSTCEANCCNSP